MNFENLSTEGYVAFILAIIFSIVTIASAIYFARHQKINLTLNIFITLVFPIITIFCWAYLFMNLYAFDFAMSMYVSLGSALGYGVVAFCISLLVSLLIKKGKTPRETHVEIEHKIIPETKAEKAENPSAEEKVVVAPLLITTEAPAETAETKIDETNVAEEVETAEEVKDEAEVEVKDEANDEEPKSGEVE